jgi:hypothetical protein
MKQKELKQSKSGWSIHDVMMAVDMVCGAVIVVTAWAGALGARLMTMFQIGQCYGVVMVVMGVHCAMTESTRYRKSLNNNVTASVWIIRANWLYAVAAWASVVIIPQWLSSVYIAYFDNSREWAIRDHRDLDEIMLYHGAWCMVLAIIAVTGVYIIINVTAMWFHCMREGIHPQCHCVRMGTPKVGTPRPSALEEETEKETRGEEEKTVYGPHPWSLREWNVSLAAAIHGAAIAAHNDTATDT